MRKGHLRGSLPPLLTRRQLDVLAAYVEAGGSVPGAATLVGIRPSTAKRHLADLRARSGLTTEQLIYAGCAAGWLVVPSLEDSRVGPLDFGVKEPTARPRMSRDSSGLSFAGSAGRPHPLRRQPPPEPS
jgi:hypothetical protein